MRRARNARDDPVNEIVALRGFTRGDESGLLCLRLLMGTGNDPTPGTSAPGGGCDCLEATRDVRGFLCSLLTLRTCEDVHPFLMGACDGEGLGLCGLMLVSRPPMVPIHEGVRLRG